MEIVRDHAAGKSLDGVHEKCHVHATVNKVHSVNIESVSEVEQQLAAQIQSLFSHVPWLPELTVEASDGDSRYDFLATMPSKNDAKSFRLVVECKMNPRPSDFIKMHQKMAEYLRENQSNAIPVLGAPFISPRIEQKCREHGWSWYDLAGNCFLNIPDRFILERSGRKPVVYPRSAKTQVNLGTREASRVIRVLLSPAGLQCRWTQRDLAKECVPEVSLGLVNKVIFYLREEAYLKVGEEGGFHVQDPVGLLTAWRDSYRFSRHQRLSYFTLIQGRKLHEALAGFGATEPGQGQIAYASFSAADIQAPNVRQSKVWLYVDRGILDKFSSDLEAKPVDSGENLVILIPEDRGVFYGSEVDPGRLACTSPVQTYVDLYHSKGRGQEAADSLFEQKLKREWRAQGINI